MSFFLLLSFIVLRILSCYAYGWDFFFLHKENYSMVRIIHMYLRIQELLYPKFK